MLKATELTSQTAGSCSTCGGIVLKFGWSAQFVHHLAGDNLT